MKRREAMALVRRELAPRWGLPAETLMGAGVTLVPAEDVYFHMATFGDRTLVRAGRELYGWCAETLAGVSPDGLMDGETLYQVERKLRRHRHRLAGEHVRYVYVGGEAVPRPERYAYRLFELGDMAALYRYPGFQSALNYRRDVLALGAFEGEALVALAGADDLTGARLWQIGIDVRDGSRRAGLAAYLVRQLAEAVIGRGALPFYTTWSANLGATLTALRAGFLPGWVEYFAEPLPAQGALG